MLVAVPEAGGRGFQRFYVLENSKEEPSGAETAKVAYHASEGHDDAPAGDDTTQVERRSLKLAEDIIAWNFYMER